MGGGVYMPLPEDAAGHPATTSPGITRSSAASSAARAVRRLFGEMQGEQLSRVPKGFCADHPAADLLRYKQFLFYIELPAEIATTPAVHREIVKRFRAIAPFMDFLNAALPRERRKIDPRDSV